MGTQSKKPGWITWGCPIERIRITCRLLLEAPAVALSKLLVTEKNHPQGFMGVCLEIGEPGPKTAGTPFKAIQEWVPPTKTLSHLWREGATPIRGQLAPCGMQGEPRKRERKPSRSWDLLGEDVGELYGGLKKREVPHKIRRDWSTFPLLEEPSFALGACV